MIDIVRLADGEDIGLYDTEVERAKNVLSIQIDSLEYIPDFGIDLKYFLSEDFEFQNESFKSYCIQRLASYSINVTSVVEEINSLFNSLVFNIGTQNNAGGGMVAR